TYAESNTFTSLNPIVIGEDGLWDFALIDNNGAPSTTYCLRIVKDSGVTFGDYTSIGEVTTAAGIVNPTFEQPAYRMFANPNSTDVGASLAAQDAPATLTSDGLAFRMRTTVHVADSSLSAGAQDFKLQ